MEIVLNVCNLQEGISCKVQTERSKTMKGKGNESSDEEAIEKRMLAFQSDYENRLKQTHKLQVGTDFIKCLLFYI